MKTIKKSIVILFAICLFISPIFSITSFAGSVNNVTLGSSYVTVLGNGACSNKNVTIICYNTSSLHHNDVRMKDSSGNVVWEEYGAIDYSSQRTFYCGSNVYSIEVRIGAKNILGDLVPKTGSCNVTW